MWFPTTTDKSIWRPTVSSDELYHHGILGMKWGTRNGPPYPLSAGSHSSSEKSAGWKKSIGGGRNESMYGQKRKVSKAQGSAEADTVPKATRKVAEKDAKAYAKAYAATGEGAGNKRKKMKAIIEQHKKDYPGYEEAFNKAYENVDKAKAANSAATERAVKDTAKGIKKAAKTALSVATMFGSEKQGGVDPRSQKKIDAIQKDIDSFKGHEKGIYDNKGNLLLSSEDVKNIVDGLKSTQDKIRSKSEAKNAKKGEKVQKEVDAIQKDIDSFKGHEKGIYDKKGRMLLSPDDVASMVDSLKQEKQNLINKAKSKGIDNVQGSILGSEKQGGKRPDQLEISKSDSSVTKGVKKDYNELSDKEFKNKYKTTKEVYAKRVEKWGDPYKNAPLSNLSRELSTREKEKGDKLNAIETLKTIKDVRDSYKTKEGGPIKDTAKKAAKKVLDYNADVKQKKADQTKADAQDVINLRDSLSRRDNKRAEKLETKAKKLRNRADSREWKTYTNAMNKTVNKAQEKADRARKLANMLDAAGVSGSSATLKKKAEYLANKYPGMDPKDLLKMVKQQEDI